MVVNDEGIAQLADFGLSTVGDDNETVNSSLSLSSCAGNPRWLAPELLCAGVFNGSGKSTRESDVYAFGMTALEVCCTTSLSTVVHRPMKYHHPMKKNRNNSSSAVDFTIVLFCIVDIYTFTSYVQKFHEVPCRYGFAMNKSLAKLGTFSHFWPDFANIFDPEI